MLVADKSGKAKKAPIGPVLSNAKNKLKEIIKKGTAKGIIIIHTRGVNEETFIAEESCDWSSCDRLISIVSLVCMSCLLPAYYVK